MSSIQEKPILLIIVTTSDESLIRTTIPEGPPGAHELLKGYVQIHIEAKTKRVNDKRSKSGSLV